MPGFDDIVKQATARLRIDRELQLEIQHELRSHLEDAAEEYQAAGYETQAAEAEAAKAFGSADELGEQLWQANRSRIRLRYWVKWVARVSLVPLCLLVTFYFLANSVMGFGKHGSFTRAGPHLTWLPSEREQLRDELTEDQYLIAFGVDGADDLESARARHERWPNDPAYLAAYVNVTRWKWSLHYERSWNEATQSFEARETPDPAQVEQFLALLDRGRQLEPANGYYDLLEAALLFNHSSEMREDKSATHTTYKPRRGVEPVAGEDHPRRLVVFDEAMFQQGLAAFARAADAEYVEDWQFELTRRQMEQLPPADHLYELVFHIERAIATLLPALSDYRRAGLTSALHAVELADAGQWEAAQAWLDRSETLSRQLAADSQSLIELLVATSIYSSTLQARYDAAVAAERPAAAEQAWAAMVSFQDEFYQVARNPERQLTKDDLKHADTLMSILLPAVSGLEVDLAPLREIEYALVDRSVLGMLMLLFDAVVILLLVVTGWLLWRRRRRNDQPVLLWIGWRRLAAVVGLGVILPIVAFGAYLWLSPFAAREYGLWAVPSRTAIDYVLAMVLILMLVWHLGLETIRRRAAAVGIESPKWNMRSQLPFVGFVLLAAVVVVVVAIIGSPDAGAAVLPVLCIATLIWLVRQGLWVWQPTAPPSAWLTQLAAVVLLTATGAALGYLSVFLGFAYTGSARHGEGAARALVAGAVTAIVVMIVAMYNIFRYPSRTPVFSASVVRSLPPIFAAAALVIAVLAGPVLSHIEQSRVRYVQTDVGYPFLDYEIDRSDYRFVRERVATGHWPADAPLSITAREISSTTPDR